MKRRELFKALAALPLLGLLEPEATIAQDNNDIEIIFPKDSLKRVSEQLSKSWPGRIPFEFKNIVNHRITTEFELQQVFGLGQIELLEDIPEGYTTEIEIEIRNDDGSIQSYLFESKAPVGTSTWTWTPDADVTENKVPTNPYLTQGFRCYYALDSLEILHKGKSVQFLDQISSVGDYELACSYSVEGGTATYNVKGLQLKSISYYNPVENVGM